MSTAGVVVSAERPARWINAALARIGALDPLELRFVTIAEDAGRDDRSPLTRRLLDLYSVADARAYPLGPYALEPAPLSADIRPLIHREPPLPEVDWLVDLRDGEDARFVGAGREGLLRPRHVLLSSGDRSWLDAIRHRSPVACRIELVDSSGSRVVAETIGACHPLSLRHTLDASCRRAEVLLERALGRLAEGM
jgi:hypothetical protein